MEEERNGALWDGNEKTIFNQPHHQQCVQLRVSTSPWTRSIFVFCRMLTSGVIESATADLHSAAKPHGYPGRHYISEDKSVRSAASPQVFLAAHVRSCLSPSRCSPPFSAA